MVCLDYLGTYGSYHMWNVLCGYRIKNGIPTYAIQYRIGTDLDGAGPGAVSWSSWINGTARAMQGDYVQAVTCIGVPGISTFNVQIQGIDGSLPPYVSLYRGWAGFRLELP